MIEKPNLTEENIRELASHPDFALLVELYHLHTKDTPTTSNAPANLLPQESNSKTTEKFKRK